MSDHIKDREETTKDERKNKESQKPSFWDWLIHGKGTVSEPWPTAKEVLQYDSVKKDIKKVQKAFDAYQAKSKKS